MSAVNKLSKEKVDECKNIFNLNDKKKSDSIPCSKLALIYRSLGAFVPDQDLDEFIGNKREIKFEKFWNFFDEYYTKKIEKQQIIMGLSFLDENNDGNISASDLKHALTSIGEKLTDEEAYNLIKTHTDKNGMIDYKKFAGEISK